ncbi:hypothetical protein PVAND_013640 [Polypedilum vanderplanki]|uniref:Oligopeptide transporter 1 n=1 Tax=Polypedilum vanderplanki TaxID=319348 RepID=A0A9J6CQX4_POLVA|nr:hypothetical protein PVAND_013640 [Polypedilum vanderplanki]
MSENDNKNETQLEEKRKDVEQSQVKLKYPRAIPFIISNEFCERFNFYGMKAILVLFLTRKLMYDDDISTIIYHTFNCLVYFFCIFGAIIADSWWGKFNTILYLSIVYVIGSGTMALAAVEPWIAIDPGARALTITGLFLIALGSGGIKPCVAAFGGEQFKMPEQAKQLATFFSLFYFSINAGSLISTSVTPILREDIPCFGMDDCFPLAFGVPAILMVVAILFFLFGKFLYKILPNQGNMLVKVCKCIGNAISTRKHEKQTSPREHWLDYGETKYGRKLVLETKILLNILVLYLPLPFFWALFDQQGSRWTFQATRMDGDIGFYTIKPDQMQVVNPLLILIFIPLYEVAFYPLLNLIGIRRPLQKLTLGGIFAGVAFVISAIVEINLEPTYAVLPDWGQAQLRFYNGRNCNYRITTNIPGHTTINVAAYEYWEEKFIDINNGRQFFSYSFSSTSNGCTGDTNTGVWHVEERTAKSFFLTGTNNLALHEFEDSTEKSRRGWPFITVLANLQTNNTNIRLLEDGKNERYNEPPTFMNQTDIQANKNYEIFVGNTRVANDVHLALGGVYSLMITQTSASGYNVKLVTVTDPNSVSMLWLIPQYVIMTLGEVMFSVTGLEFSFTQAPESMKSVIQGCWMLTVAFGNLIVVIITGAKFFDSQTYEFFLFAGLMFVDMILFSWLAYRYKAIPLELLQDIDENKDEKKPALEFNNNTTEN